MRTFDSLTEREILALAISLEEEDARIYEDFADGLQDNYPEQAKKFREMFEINIEPDCAWAGVFGETKDGLPYIGPHKQFPLGLFALGYGGNGITFSLVAAEIIRDNLRGHPNPDSSIFSFER